MTAAQQNVPILKVKTKCAPCWFMGAEYLFNMVTVKLVLTSSCCSQWCSIHHWAHPRVCLHKISFILLVSWYVQEDHKMEETRATIQNKRAVASQFRHWAANTHTVLCTLWFGHYWSGVRLIAGGGEQNLDEAIGKSKKTEHSAPLKHKHSACLACLDQGQDTGTRWTLKG